MRRGLAVIAAAALLALGSSSARGQGINFGTTTCEGCTAVVDLAQPDLFAFLVRRPDTIVEPDVLFDERSTGGIAIGADVSLSQWWVPMNWREPFLPSPSAFVAIINEGTIFVDSSELSINDMGLETAQVLCSFPGRMAPRVSVAGADWLIEWAPIVELNTTPVGSGCTVAGEAVRGHVIGYDIYRLAWTSGVEPARRQFVTSGYHAHADLSLLDFGVVDVDGSGGSDLDASDGLTLRNPDGLPDTGDEILIFTDAGATSGLYWYRVQPVVQGAQSFYDTGLTSINMIPATRLDLSGDGILDGVDIGFDGTIEFIDPSGRGLGLTWGGEIASSYFAGLGEPAALLPDCQGNPIAGVVEDCDSGIDEDGDGLVDCFDVIDCCTDPSCAVTPLEVRRVDVGGIAAGASDVRVSWTPIGLGDLISGSICRRISAPDPRAPGCLWQDRSTVASACLAEDSTTPSFTDTRAIDPTTMGWYYLVREQSPCGDAGTFGSDSRGVPRVEGPASCSP